MPKRITELTTEQRARFQEWVDKWTKIGLSTEPMDIERFTSAVKVAYAKAKQQPWPNKPVIVCSSPLVLGLAAAIAESILKDRRKGSAVRSAVDSAVGLAVDSAVGLAVRSAVDLAVDSAVGSAVRSAVDSAVGSAVGLAVDSAVDSAVRSDVDSAVDSAVYSAVGSAVRSAVGSAVDSAVDSAVYSAVGSAVEILKSMQWHPWIGGQFWVGGYWGSPSYVSFFTDVCGLELDSDIVERANAFSEMCQSSSYYCVNSDFVMVADRPCIIHRDTDGQLHNPHGLAIEWRDGWGLHMIHGVKFTAEQHEKAKTASVAELIAWEDIEQRAALLRDRPIEDMIAACGRLIHETSGGDNYQIVHEGPDAEHGIQKVQAGVREVRHEMEHDPFKNELRVVVD